MAYCILARQYLKDPSFDFNDEYSKTFTAFKVLMIILLGIGLAWMFYGFAQILKMYNNLIWRHKIFFSFSCYFIFCYFICKPEIFIGLTLIFSYVYRHDKCLQFEWKQDFASFRHYKLVRLVPPSYLQSLWKRL